MNTFLFRFSCTQILDVTVILFASELTKSVIHLHLFGIYSSVNMKLKKRLRQAKNNISHSQSI